eukprot:scaffold111791_cov25-Prasinocladus_malaysianus.AAC.1
MALAKKFHASGELHGQEGEASPGDLSVEHKLSQAVGHLKKQSASPLLEGLSLEPLALFQLAAQPVMYPPVKRGALNMYASIHINAIPAWSISQIYDISIVNVGSVAMAPTPYIYVHWRYGKKTTCEWQAVQDDY